MINLIRDVLDKLLVDVNDRYVGRVDGIILEIRRNLPPRVAAVEIGAETAARRVHPRLGQLVRSAASRLGAEPVRLPLSAFKHVGVHIELPLAGDKDPRLLRFEKWLSRTVVQRIPGGRTQSKSAEAPRGKK